MMGLGGEGASRTSPYRPKSSASSSSSCVAATGRRRGVRRWWRWCRWWGEGEEGGPGWWSGGGVAHHLYGHHADVEGGALSLLLHCRLLRHLRSTDGRLDNRGAQAQGQTDAQEQALRAAAGGSARMGGRARGVWLRVEIISRC